MSSLDSAFPVLHVRPSSGWLNDPNGPFRWRGRYHLFFQHNPDGSVHGDICWGHASSTDLLRWEFEPVALRPTPGGPDRGGCWSGCVVDDGGVPTAVYSGLVEAHHRTTVCLARALDPDDDRLREWSQEPVPVLEPPKQLTWLGFRDPFVFTLAGRRHALVGGGVAGRGGRVELFGCDDLRRWRRLGPLLDLTDAVAAEIADAEIWECPQLFPVDGRWVLVLSLVKDGALTRVVHLTGALDRVGPDWRNHWRLRPSTGGLVDHGHDFYAPAVLVEEERTLLWGWSWEDRPLGDVATAGWAGVLTLPRVLALDERERLVTEPAPELLALRQAFAVHQGVGDVPVPEGPFEVVMTAERPVLLHLGDLVVEVDSTASVVRTRRKVAEPLRRQWRTEGPLPAGAATVRVFVDASIVEVFVDDGPTFTERVYPEAGRWPVRLQGEPPVGVTVHALRVPA